MTYTPAASLDLATRVAARRGAKLGVKAFQEARATGKDSQIDGVTTVWTDKAGNAYIGNGAESLWEKAGIWNLEAEYDFGELVGSRKDNQGRSY
jgi:hypothetical protein